LFRNSQPEVIHIAEIFLFGFPSSSSGLKIIVVSSAATKTAFVWTAAPGRPDFTVSRAQSFFYSAVVVTLKGSNVFGQLAPAELKALESIAVGRTFERGREIFREGDAGDGVYFLQSGLVEISGVMGENSRQVFSQVRAGDIFGEMAVFEDKPRSASAMAKENSQAYFFDRQKTLELVGRSPALSMVLLREISNRLREFNGQYLREVVQAERLAIVGRFARSIVHDLKNPLNIIGLTAEMVNAPATSAGLREQATTTIRKQVDRINDMIGEILEFTQGPQMAVVLAASPYSEFVDHMMNELRPEVGLKSAVLELENQPPEIALQMDPRRLRRVYCNLIANATEAMPRGGKIILRFRTTPKEIVTEIQDSGKGIAPEIAGELFEAFATHGKENGTGLGLSISKRIIEDHRGWISARNVSDNGQGAIFSFGLPRQ
jgi:signal transduction histidine kinase